MRQNFFPSVFATLLYACLAITALQVLKNVFENFGVSWQMIFFTIAGGVLLFFTIFTFPEAEVFVQPVIEKKKEESTVQKSYKDYEPAPKPLFEKEEKDWGYHAVPDGCEVLKSEVREPPKMEPVKKKKVLDVEALKKIGGG